MKSIISTVLMLLMSITIFASEDNSYVVSDFFRNLQSGDKAAILMVHFGTTHDDTRLLTIDAINKKVEKEFPGVDVREAYTSRIIIKRLKDNKGIDKPNPLEALKQLHDEGYTHILIQASNIIDGVEMESLEKNVEEVKPLFKDIRVGMPLLYSPKDYENLIEVLTKNNDANTAYVWVGHGTDDPTTAQYAMLDYMLKAKGHKNCFVGTIEGYPAYDDMLSQLKTSGLKKVVLIPLMFVAGEHAKNDISEEWKSELEKEGFQVSVKMEGLGQNADIQDLYVSHLEFAAKHRKIGIMEKKAIYQRTGEKL